MKRQIQNARLLILVWTMLGGLLASPATQAQEAQENSAPEQQNTTFVYDRQTGDFVRVQRHNPSDYRLGNLKMNVGYDQRVYRTKDAWSSGVTRYLIKRPLDE